MEIEQDRGRMQALLASAETGRAAFLAGEKPLTWRMVEVARGVAASGLVAKKRGEKEEVKKKVEGEATGAGAAGP